MRFASYVPSERMRWGLGDVGLGLALFAIVLVGAATLLTMIGGFEPAAVNFAVGIASYSALAFAVVRASRRKGLRSLAADFGLSFAPIDAVIGVAVGLAIKGLSVAVTLAAIAVTGNTPDEGNLTLSRDVLWIVLGGVVVTSMLAPVVEELFFRGLMFRSVRNIFLRGDRALDSRAQRHAVATAIVANSVLFMLLHSWQATDVTLLIALALSTLLVGIANSFLVAITGRLGPGIIAHVVFNATAVFALLGSR